MGISPFMDERPSRKRNLNAEILIFAHSHVIVLQYFFNYQQKGRPTRHLFVGMVRRKRLGCLGHVARMSDAKSVASYYLDGLPNHIHNSRVELWQF